MSKWTLIITNINLWAFYRIAAFFHAFRLTVFVGPSARSNADDVNSFERLEW